MLIIIFYLALIFTIYTYIVFPIILFMIAKVFNKRDRKVQGVIKDSPKVAIICAMYNEEKIVHKKIENFLNLEYENIKLYIGSDGSNDRTNFILEQYSTNNRIIVYKFPRRGKVYVINDLVAKADADILVFTDANSMFKADAIQHLLRHFSNKQIGVVCGRLKLIKKGQISGEGFYWRYETTIKKLENIFNCVIGANGAIYAIRKKLVAPVPTNTINDDFTISMRVLERGYGIVFEENAIVHEEINHDDSVEFKRHIRDGAGHYRALLHLYRLLNPLKFKIFFLYVSHRVIRWFVPMFLILMLICPIFTEGHILIRWLFIAEVIFYFLVVIGWLTKTKNIIFYIPYYFIYINIALLFGFFKNIFGTQKATWDSTAR